MKYAAVVCGLISALASAACGAPPLPKRVSPSIHGTQNGDEPSPKKVPRKMIGKTPKVDVVDDYFGTKIHDPYRWLEDGESPSVKAWTDEQNLHTRKILDAIPKRAALHAQLKTLLEVGTVSPPVVRLRRSSTREVGAYYFHTKRSGLQNQPVLYVRSAHDGNDRPLIDAATFSADGTTALDWWYPSWEGNLVAWGLSEGGSEESTLSVRNVDTGTDLADKIPRTRHATVAWRRGGKSFFYTRYPEAGSVPPGDEKYFMKVFEHALGDDPKNDKVVFGDGRTKTDIPEVSISPNGRWLVIRVHEGWEKSEVYVRDLSGGDTAPWVGVATHSDALFNPIPLNDKLYIHTNEGAPRYRLVEVDYASKGHAVEHASGRAHWKEIIPERADVLTDVTPVNHGFVANYLHEASSRVERFGTDGKSLGEIALPGVGSAVVSGAWDGSELFVEFASYVTPPRVARIDLRTNVTADWDRVGDNLPVDDVEVTRLYATSKDGTRVPMFVVAKKGVKKDGTNALLLWGYGGFNVNQTPAFSARALATVANGGIWVTAVLRGGGEFGEAWHRAGMLSGKQRVFDDFIACAEKLIADGLTAPSKLGIIGGSNGGLLVAAALTQRPELFRVALSLVPLTDMLRYERFRIAKLWIPEYGTAENQSQFQFLKAYSPYHRVVDGASYPAVLLTTAESDSRVDPMHARKMAARLQEAQTASDRPILIRVEKKAGHGAGKPVHKLVDELTDELAFGLHELGIF